MDGYCLITRLVEEPNICLYYKGVEENGCAPSALEVVVALSSADALIMDRGTAELLCNQLNKDKAILLANGYTAFEIEPQRIAP